MLWGGRFEEKLNDDAMKFSSSLSFDINLVHEDIQVSKVHAEMLCRIELINENELADIIRGLNKIEICCSEGSWKPDESKFEDVHSAIEAELFNIIGDVAGKLHTGRSRNDQVATSMRLWVKNALNETAAAIIDLQKVIVDLASENVETIIPGYTHLQRAQPVSFAHHLLAYVEMFDRDKKRIEFVINETNVSPLGCGALAGSTLPLDSQFTSERLGFEYPCRNSIDAVSDRDFLLDTLNCFTIGMLHTSRLAEEIILWTTEEWSFILLSDKFTTGSSLMPQKKNPDMAELIRGKSGRVYGNQFALLTTMKALPLCYNRDMQEDKEPVFDSYNTYLQSLRIMTGMLSSLKINKDRFINDLEKGFSLATDLADWLVKKEIPFREAHHIVGQLVQQAENRNLYFNKLTLDDLKSVSDIFDETALECLKLENSLQRKKTFGSPNPELVTNQINFWKEKLN